ncbi:hypothetical protein [Flammeovirga pacifica]|uniref:Uncharacterized protein n=1 Tax=Flammeovirga pacifica TaxID=915059 RepID=A0A1S1YUA7_FLAPC|nr:hypothetical protein [Flammeovirga pacifica]OHX64610.1 hypothetical protein NH26_23860 [Flammeovirga pacifica]
MLQLHNNNKFKFEQRTIHVHGLGTALSFGMLIPLHARGVAVHAYLTSRGYKYGQSAEEIYNVLPFYFKTVGDTKLLALLATKDVSHKISQYNDPSLANETNNLFWEDSGINRSRGAENTTDFDHFKSWLDHIFDTIAGHDTNIVYDVLGGFHLTNFQFYGGLGVFYGITVAFRSYQNKVSLKEGVQTVSKAVAIGFANKLIISTFGFKAWLGFYALKYLKKGIVYSFDSVIQKWKEEGKSPERIAALERRVSYLRDLNKNLRKTLNNLALSQYQNLPKVLKDAFSYIEEFVYAGKVKLRSYFINTQNFILSIYDKFISFIKSTTVYTQVISPLRYRITNYILKPIMDNIIQPFVEKVILKKKTAHQPQKKNTIFNNLLAFFKKYIVEPVKKYVVKPIKNLFTKILNKIREIFKPIHQWMQKSKLVRSCGNMYAAFTEKLAEILTYDYSNKNINLSKKEVVTRIQNKLSKSLMSNYQFTLT